MSTLALCEVKREISIFLHLEPRKSKRLSKQLSQPNRNCLVFYVQKINSTGERKLLKFVSNVYNEYGQILPNPYSGKDKYWFIWTDSPPQDVEFEFSIWLLSIYYLHTKNKIYRRIGEWWTI